MKSLARSLGTLEAPDSRSPTTAVTETQTPIMRQCDPDREAVVEIDATDWEEEALRSRVFDDGLSHLVAYHTRKFNEAVVKFEIYDEVIIAIVDALLTWWNGREGTEIPIQIYSNDQNQQFHTTSKKLSHRQARWSEQIGPYRLKTGYQDSMTRGPEFAMVGEVIREQL